MENVQCIRCQAGYIQERNVIPDNKTPVKLNLYIYPALLESFRNNIARRSGCDSIRHKDNLCTFLLLGFHD